jgi:hypothetical protein
MYKRSRRGLTIIVGVGVLVIAIVWGLPYWQESSFAPPATAQTVTMTGYDPATGETIDPINIFDQLPMGKRIGTVPSGAQVVLISRNGDIAQIRTPNGVSGYVSARFIEEFR